MLPASAALVRHIRMKLVRLHEARLPDEYYYASLPLCVIDSVFSIGVRYESTRRTVKTWCHSQSPAWFMIERAVGTEERRSEHTIKEFIGLLDGKDFETLAQNEFKNSQRTSPTNGILKAEAAYRFACALREFDIDDFCDTENQKNIEAVRPSVLRIKGQGSGLSFDYFLMLSGSHAHVKPDRMVRRFVADALGVTDVPADTVQRLVVEVCKALQADFPNLTPRLLDYEIWTYQRARRQVPVA